MIAVVLSIVAAVVVLVVIVITAAVAVVAVGGVAVAIVVTVEVGVMVVEEVAAAGRGVVVAAVVVLRARCIFDGSFCDSCVQKSWQGQLLCASVMFCCQGSKLPIFRSDAVLALSIK